MEFTKQFFLFHQTFQQLIAAFFSGIYIIPLKKVAVICQNVWWNHEPWLVNYVDYCSSIKMMPSWESFFQVKWCHESTRKCEISTQFIDGWSVATHMHHFRQHLPAWAATKLASPDASPINMGGWKLTVNVSTYNNTQSDFLGMIYKGILWCLQFKAYFNFGSCCHHPCGHVDPKGWEWQGIQQCPKNSMGQILIAPWPTRPTSQWSIPTSIFSMEVVPGASSCYNANVS